MRGATATPSRSAAAVFLCAAVLLALALVLETGCLLDSSALGVAHSEYRCWATVANAEGQREVVVSDDAEFCWGGYCRRFFSYCQATPEERDLAWRKLVRDVVEAEPTFRDIPGPWVCAE